MSAEYKIIDPRFRALFNGNGHVEKLATGFKWAEGPAWFGGGRYLIWSDIPNNRMMRYDETDGVRLGVPQPLGQFQRQHRRPTGAPDLLRAWRPARQPHRA